MCTQACSLSVPHNGDMSLYRIDGEVEGNQGGIM